MKQPSLNWKQTSITFLMMLPLFATLFAQNSSQTTYYAGGTVPFDTQDKVILDRHADILSLGVNHDWLKSSWLDPTLYTQAIDIVGLAAKKQEIPGAVIMVDRYMGKTMPAAIGWMMTDPQPHRLQTDTQFYVEDLTGPLVVAPLTWKALAEGKLSLDDNITTHLLFLKNTPSENITIEMLLRHSSGLPPQIPSTPPISNQLQLESVLSSIKPTTPPGTATQKSPLNFLLLGMILEKVNDKPLSEQLNEMVELYFGGGITSMVLRTDFRFQLAPGQYHPYLKGRMAWGEPTEPLGEFLAPNAGHTGLILDADGMSECCQALMTASVMGILPDLATPEMTEILKQVFQPNPKITNTPQMGLGIELGRFGTKSFGWDSPSGYSFWVLPDQFSYIIFLSNWNHPHGKKQGDQKLREKTLTLLAKSSGWSTSAVDTGTAKNDSPSALSHQPPRGPDRSHD